MSKQLELEKLDRSIRDAEIRIHTMNANIHSLTKEIELLEKLERVLSDNVRLLKKNNIIAIATEFKKAKEDLEKTKNKLILLQNDRETFKKSVDVGVMTIEKAREDMAELKKTGESNVLHGKFGKKDNG